MGESEGNIPTFNITAMEKLAGINTTQPEGFSSGGYAYSNMLVDENGEVHGGPVYYIRTAFKGAFGKVLAVFFAVAITLALGFMGAMVQSNSIAENTAGAFAACRRFGSAGVMAYKNRLDFAGGV